MLKFKIMQIVHGINNTGLRSKNCKKSDFYIIFGADYGIFIFSVLYVKHIW